jgi:hypothetical protein
LTVFGYHQLAAGRTGEVAEARSRAEAALAGYAAALARDAPRWEWRLSEKPPVRFFWRVLDLFDYWRTQARLWLTDVVCGPEP